MDSRKISAKSNFGRCGPTRFRTSATRFRTFRYPSLSVYKRFYSFSLWLAALLRASFAPQTVKHKSTMIETEFLNRVELRGRVGHDPRVTSVGDASVARFSVATNEAFRGKNGELREETTWHNVTAWAGRNIMDFKNIRKGTFVSLVGRLRNTRFTGQDGNERNVVEIVASRLEPFSLATT